MRSEVLFVAPVTDNEAANHGGATLNMGKNDAISGALKCKFNMVKNGLHM